MNSWVNNREAGNLKRHRAHYDVIVMSLTFCGKWIGHPSQNVRKVEELWFFLAPEQTMGYLLGLGDNWRYYKGRGTYIDNPWWRHQMETFSAGPGEFPAQRPLTRSFDVFFDLHLNKRLSKQSWGWCILRRYCTHYDVVVILCVSVRVYIC